MTTKFSPFHILGSIVLISLVACGKPAAAAPAETVTPLPTFTSVPATITPSPMPTRLNYDGITPSAIQVEQWEEYQDALAVATFGCDGSINGVMVKCINVLCEWEILGQSGQDVYVWSICEGDISYDDGAPSFSGGELPAVFQLDENGYLQNILVPRGGGSRYGEDIRQLFPPDIAEILFDFQGIDVQEYEDHLMWRLEHPGEPPLVVLSAAP